MKNGRLLPAVITIEGNIGAGKSTMVQILESRGKARVAQEPADLWVEIRGSDGKNLLQLFYDDMNRWAYTFQAYAFVSRIKRMVSLMEKETDVVVAERSVLCDRFCFAKNLRKKGRIGEVEWKVYTDWFEWLMADLVPYHAGFVYLRADPEEVSERIKKRGRPEEAAISLEYLWELHNLHEEWLGSGMAENGVGLAPVLILDANKDFESDPEIQEEYVRKIEKFVEETSLSLREVGTAGLETKYAVRSDGRNTL